jgi:HTH-type transcriptional regulator/antitoxin HigA
MITNEKQFRSTRTLVDKLKESRDALAGDNSGLPPELLAIQRDALTSQIDELDGELQLYERLRGGQVTSFQADNLSELPDILIQARIARGMSQKDLADYLGMKEQQVQRYEAERYRSASLDRLVEVSDALGVRIHKRAELIGDNDLSSIDPAAWNTFPVAEMYKRGWFEDFAGTMSQARKAAAKLIPAFLVHAQAHYAPAALHRKSVRASGQVHEAAIVAWEARVRQLAQRSPPEAAFDRDRIDSDWLKGLLALTLLTDGPAKAVDYLLDAGIALIIERQLPGTLLDGAALCSLDRHAIIALTLRHDRLDNFWFTLFHEIGHLKLHIGRGDLAAIFDDTDAPAATSIEEEADYFAQEALLPSDQWKIGASRYARTEKAVLVDARRFGVGPAIIAGRIRREAGDYTLLRGLVGNGQVRPQFGL